MANIRVTPTDYTDRAALRPVHPDSPLHVCAPRPCDPDAHQQARAYLQAADSTTDAIHSGLAALGRCMAFADDAITEPQTFNALGWLIHELATQARLLDEERATARHTLASISQTEG